MNALARRLAHGLAGWATPAGPNAPMALEQVLPLDGRRRLCLVRCGDRRLLLLIGGPNDVALGWPLAQPPETAAS